MAHDSTRAWPLGIGPDQTAIPGAAWLELLDGQAFPVVGAGTMVRDGNAWTPASSSNPLHVRAQALEQLIGALDATKETNPDAASASMLALLRGLIAIVGKEATLGQILAALGAPAQESTLVDVLAALSTLAGTVDSGAVKTTLSGHLGLEFVTFVTPSNSRMSDSENQTITLVEETVPCVLDVMELATDSVDLFWRLSGRTASGTFIPIGFPTSSVASANNGFAVSYILRRPTPVVGPFEYLGKWHDSTNKVDHHYVTLTHKLEFPFGFRIQVITHQGSGWGARYSLRCTYRRMG